MSTVTIPRLDDTDFDALVAEARSLIPRFAPEWTDHNLHDPGITIIDLLAYLVDQQIYRIGMVGPSLQAAFARLMGITPRPASAGRFLVWPTPGQDLPLLDLARLSPVTSTDLPDGNFMLDADLRSTAARIADIVVTDATGAKPIGAGLVAGRTSLPLPPPGGGGPRFVELVLDRPFVAAPGAGPVSLGVDLRAPQPRPEPDAGWDTLVMEERIGGGPWRRVESDDGTLGLTRSGVLLFHPAEGGGTDRLRLRLDRSFRAGTVTLLRIDFNVVPVREGWQDVEEVVGVGTGLPDQVFDFPTADIDHAETPLVVESAGPDGLVPWIAVPDLAASGPEDRHVVIDAEAGTLTLGNGVNGALLPEGRQLRHRPLVRTSGTGGNVARGLRWTIAGRVWGENIAEGTGGRDRDTLDDLIARARAAASRRCGALSVEDLATQAEAAGFGLGGLTVVAGRRPGALANGSRTVVAIPDRAPGHLPGPPRPDFSEALAEVLAPARLMGERLLVSAPIYVPVHLKVTLDIRADADASAVEREAESLIRARLWDLDQPGSGIDPWTPGRPLGDGDIRALMARIEDVIRMAACEIHFDDAVEEENGLFALGDRTIPIARNVSVAARAAGGTSP